MIQKRMCWITNWTQLDHRHKDDSNVYSSSAVYDLVGCP